MKRFKAPVYTDNSDIHHWMGVMWERTWNIKKFAKSYEVQDRDPVSLYQYGTDLGRKTEA